MAGALAASRLLTSLLFEVKPSAPAAPAALPASILWWPCATSSDAQHVEQAAGGLRHLPHGRVECLLVGLRRLAVAADLAHELQRRRGDLLASDGFIGTPEYFNAAAHTGSQHYRTTAGVGGRLQLNSGLCEDRRCQADIRSDRG